MPQRERRSQYLLERHTMASPDKGYRATSEAKAGPCAQITNRQNDNTNLLRLVIAGASPVGVETGRATLAGEITRCPFPSPRFDSLSPQGLCLLRVLHPCILPTLAAQRNFLFRLFFDLRLHVKKHA